jgi:hypothetical protein
MDPNLKSFAVFINSNSSLYKSTSKSKVNIPFNGNLATADPHKLLRVALSQMKFTNSVYNITEANNTLRICAQFSNGRGYDASYGTDQQLNRRLWQTWTIRIPIGYYDTQTLSTVLSEPGILYPETQTGESAYLNRVGYQSVKQRFEYNVDHITYQDCFVGFGAIPADPADPISTKGVITVDENSKVVFQTADLAHLVQYGTDINTPVENILAAGAPDEEKNSNTLDYSMVYKAVHLLFDVQTKPLLETLGFFNIDTIPPPSIDGYCDNEGIPRSYSGYSIYFIANCLKDQLTTNAWDNTTYYTFDLTLRSVLTVTPPSFLQIPKVVAGHIYGTTLAELSPVLLLRDQSNDDGSDYYSAALGDFLAGTGITQPNPFLVSSTVSVPATNPFELDFYAGAINIVSVAQATWIANAGWGLQVGYPIRPVHYADALASSGDFVADFIGYYVIGINDAVDPVQITLNQNYTLIIPGPITLEVEWKTYTLSRSQTVQNVGAGTTYVAMVVSGDPVSTAAAELRPNTLSNLQGLDEIYVHCPQLRTVHFSSSQRQKLAPSDVICVIPVDVVFGSKQTYQPPVILDAFLSNTNVTNLEITLTDSNNTELDFNGVDWSMVLKCEEVDVDTMNALAQQGLFNTPFQDQLQLLEGTARQEIRAKRGRLPYEFYELSKSRKI